VLLIKGGLRDDNSRTMEKTVEGKNTCSVERKEDVRCPRRKGDYKFRRQILEAKNIPLQGGGRDVRLLGPLDAIHP